MITNSTIAGLFAAGMLYLSTCYVGHGGVIQAKTAYVMYSSLIRESLREKQRVLKYHYVASTSKSRPWSAKQHHRRFSVSVGVMAKPHAYDGLFLHLEWPKG